MLLDRPLSLFLKANNRYVVIAREFQPLEGRVLEKIQKHGEVFSTGPSLFSQYPELQSSIAELSKICLNEDLAPFEKSLKTRELLEWLVPCFFSFTKLDQAGERIAPDLRPGIFLILNTFNAPPQQTLLFLSEMSLSVYEDSLKVAAVAGVLALWLEYCDENFIRRLVTTVFCAEIGVFSNDISIAVVNAILHSHGPFDEPLAAEERQSLANRYQVTLEMIRDGKVPGVDNIDRRLGCLLGTHDAGAFDPLAQIVILSRWLARLGKPSETLELPWHNRAFQKICESLELQLFDNQESAA